MLKNYITIALRNFWNHKIFSLINISGLAIGISASLVIYLIVQYEFSFEQFQKDKDRIFRVVSKIEFPDLLIHNSGVPLPTGDAIRKEIDGLEAVSNITTNYEIKVAISNNGNSSPKLFKRQEHIIFTDADYFNIFQYEWLAGSAGQALNEPFQVVLTESRASTYFPDYQPGEMIGKTIVYEDSILAKVTGVVKDISKATAFNFKEFFSKTTIENTFLKSRWDLNEWGSINSSTQLFVKLSKNTLPINIETKLVSIREKYREKNEKNEGDDTKHFLQPLTDIHFNSDYSSFDESGARQANKTILWSLLAVALFILILACINFINLTTAQASQRAKEIGIRKTLGVSKSELITQYLGETLLFTIIATVLSITLCPILLNVFRDFIPPQVTFQSINQPHVWIFLVSLAILVSLLSGFYPALVLSKFKPIAVLKNQSNEGNSPTRKSWLRQTLTVSQFVITQVLLICTLALSKQIHYSLNKELGYKKDAIVFINTERDIFSNEKDERRFILLDKLKSIPEIEQVSLGSTPPASVNTNSTTMKFNNGKTIVETNVETKFAEPNYFKIYNMKLVAGDFLKSSDTTKEFLINQTYAKALGFTDPHDAVGKLLERSHKLFPVAGVIADFHTKSTHEAIKPLAFSSNLSNSYALHIALIPKTANADTWKRALTKIENEYKTLYPEDVFKFKFFDESIAAFYNTEQNIIRLLKWSSGICIFISCLGLLGLVIFTTHVRTKEIGVRKVLGASISQILQLISKDFIKLIILAFIIAAPLAWLGVNRWMQGFEYRAHLGWLIYFMVAFGAVSIALITIGFQAIKAANANPVKSLRTE